MGTTLHYISSTSINPDECTYISATSEGM